MYNHAGRWYLPSLWRFLAILSFFSVGGEQVAWHKLLLSAFSVVASIWKSFPCNQTISFYVFILSHTDRNCCVLDFKDTKYLHCSVQQVTAWSDLQNISVSQSFKAEDQIIVHSDVCADCSINWVSFCVGWEVQMPGVEMGQGPDCNLLHRLHNNLW